MSQVASNALSESASKIEQSWNKLQATSMQTASNAIDSAVLTQMGKFHSTTNDLRYQNTAADAEKKLKSAQNKIDKASAKVQEQQSEVDKAKAALDAAQVSQNEAAIKRAQKNYDRAKSKLEDAEKDYNNSQENYAKTESNIQLANEKLAVSRLKSAQEKLSNAENKAQKAQEDLGKAYSELVAAKESGDAAAIEKAQKKYDKASTKADQAQANLEKSQESYNTAASQIEAAQTDVESISKQMESDTITTKEQLQEQIMLAMIGASDESAVNIASRMGEMMVCDMIAQQVMLAKQQSLGASIGTSVLINLYLGKTFGDKTFMQEVTKTVEDGLNKYLNTVYQEGVYQLDKAIDTKVNSVIHKTETTINQGFLKATSYIEKVAKFDLNKSLTDAISGALSIKGINESLNKTLLGQILKPGINVLYNAGVAAVVQKLTDNKIGQGILDLQEKIVEQQEFINRQKQLIIEQETMIKNKIDEAKKEAEGIVLDYANQVIDDISSKIGIDLGNISGQLI